jgi:hypothetical protein
VAYFLQLIGINLHIFYFSRIGARAGGFSDMLSVAGEGATQFVSHEPRLAQFWEFVNRDLISGK